MIEIHRSALILAPAKSVYDIINDIEQYPSFLDGVASARVLESSDIHMLGELIIKKAGVEKTIITRNTLKAPSAIEMTLEQGPLEALTGTWLITPLSEEGCKVSLDLRFSMKKGLTAMAFGAVFKQVANNMVDSFVQRANQLQAQ
ncbi:type II toxin-antitoxin system RatA family toxin [Reinekea marina]|uniref:Type II toxin-antitoxin system RatA family toxin n=1 Tax=Reinekea marina TaxID=1310421 RepID=A0ABV7WQ51_9GAMM|nr:type II toxin-antitoxin system RatA family toxin [Reinekea marina]MDN3650694.1 type II toxin-antitoxin system RatA family toxin [Reinekea marina]